MGTRMAAEAEGVPEPIRVRRYQAADFEELASWVADRRVFAYWGGAWFDFPLGRERFREHHREGSHVGSSVTDARGVLVGYFEIRELRPKEGRLFRVIVKKERRNQGIGRGMLKEALRVCFEDMGCEKAGLGVFSDNEAARRCYLACGFSKVGEKVSRCDMLGEEITIVLMEVTRDDWSGLAE